MPRYSPPVSQIHRTSLLPWPLPIMARDEPLHRSLLRDTTPYLIYILLVAATGPLHFGFHLVNPY